MKKQIIKLDRKQLRSLIKETIEFEQGAELDEVLIDLLREKWLNAYGVEVPRIGQSGHKELWEEQVERALKSFSYELKQKIQNTQERLYRGDYDPENIPF